MRTITDIVVHCSATRPSQDIGAAEIRSWHLERGWSDIGYHYVVRRDGTVEEGRPDSRPGAHVRNFNDHSLGVCLVGGVGESDGVTPEDNFEAVQIRAAVEHVHLLMQRHNVTLSRLWGHREVIDRITHASPKACPVLSMDGFRDAILQLALPVETVDYNWRSEMADAGEEQSEPVTFRAHVVLKGESLWGIAQGAGVQVADLYAAYRDQPDVIHPGMKVFYPVVDKTGK